MVEEVLDAVRANASPWAYVLVPAAALTDSALLLSAVVPNETVLLLAGYLSWEGEVVLPVLIVLAVVGAMLGDAVMFAVGRRYGDRVRTSRLGQKVGDRRWAIGSGVVDHYRASAIVVSRFLPGVRSIVPIAAGDARMGYGTFAAWNLLGAAAWATLYLVGGWLAGPAYRTVGEVVGYAGLALLAAVVGAVVLVRRRLVRRVEEDLERRGEALPTG